MFAMGLRSMQYSAGLSHCFWRSDKKKERGVINEEQNGNKFCSARKSISKSCPCQDIGQGEGQVKNLKPQQSCITEGGLSIMGNQRSFFVLHASMYYRQGDGESKKVGCQE